MRKVMTFLALITLIMLAADSVISIPVTSVHLYTINVTRIDPMGAAPGNSYAAVIEVIAAKIEGLICGLDVNDFSLDTLKAPIHGKNIVINSVRASAAARGQPHAPCIYSISIAPFNNRGGQNTWGEGTYALQLNYIKDGQQLASTTFNLTVT